MAFSIVSAKLYRVSFYVSLFCWKLTFHILSPNFIAAVYNTRSLPFSVVRANAAGWGRIKTKSDGFSIGRQANLLAAFGIRCTVSGSLLVYH